MNSTTNKTRAGHVNFLALAAFVTAQGFVVWQQDLRQEEYKPLPPDREHEQEVLDILARFPAAQHASAVRLVAYSHFVSFHDRKCLNTDDARYAEYVGQANVRYQAWDALADAANDGYGSNYRLSRLTDLREIIGDDLFDHGIMPQPMPCLDFPRRD